jgi:uncharacterized protein YeaO (DUF488 family)
MIKLMRAYDLPHGDHGLRYLVERLWPRGIKKSELRVDGWLKDIAPTTELRKWFSHDPARWTEFQRRYFTELDNNPEAWEPILTAARHSTVILVYSSHDEVHNNAVAFKEYLEQKLHERTRRSRMRAA